MQGVVAVNSRSMEIKVFPADAVILCTGGYASMYASTTRSLYNDGAAAMSCCRSGAAFANPEITQFCRNTFQAFGKCIPVSETVLSGIGDAAQHDMEAVSDILDLYEDVTGDDPRELPMKLDPAAAYSLGGLRVDERHATSVQGLFAAGEAACRYHGAGVLEGNEILSSLFGGTVAGKGAVAYVLGQDAPEEDVSSSLFDRAKSNEETLNSRIASREGSENAHVIAGELAELLFSSAGPSMDGSKLVGAQEEIIALEKRFAEAPLADRSEWANGEIIFMRRMVQRFELARMIVSAALEKT